MVPDTLWSWSVLALIEGLSPGAAQPPAMQHRDIHAKPGCSISHGSRKNDQTTAIQDQLHPSSEGGFTSEKSWKHKRNTSRYPLRRLLCHKHSCFLKYVYLQNQVLTFSAHNSRASPAATHQKYKNATRPQHAGETFDPCPQSPFWFMLHLPWVAEHKLCSGKSPFPISYMVSLCNKQRMQMIITENSNN